MDTYTFLAICLLFILPPEILSQCNSTDDLWSIHCVRLSPYYSDYQWATCVSNEYLSVSSGLQHKCRDNATLCYNQCMLESFDMSQGGVNSACACNPNGTLPLEPLPSRCYRPDGAYCGWYKECLEVRYPCLGTSDAHAAAYNEKLCNAYVSNYNDFSPEGRAWMNAARSCSLFALVPLVRPWTNNICADVSVASRAGCYFTPEFTRSAAGVPFLCDLSYMERVRVFWILFGSVSSDGVFQDSADQMLEMLKLCSSDDLASAPKFRTVATAVRVQCAFLGTPAVQAAQWESVARETVNSIASMLKWSALGIGWFSALGDTAVARLNITVWLVDINALGISNSSSTAESGQVGLRVAELGSAFRGGLLSSVSASLYGNEVKTEVLFVGECEEITCNQNYVSAIPATGGGKDGHVGGWVFTCALAAMLSLAICSY